MPELPEVETIRRGLEPLLVGRRVIGAWAFPHAKFTDARATVGARVEGVGRRGKFLLVELDANRQLIVHLGMTGQLLLVEPGSDPGHVRARFEFDDHSVLAFRDVRRFGRLRLVASGDWSISPTLSALGPEPFDPSFTDEALWSAVRRSRSRIKTQLLSQRPVAGVGNIYADEALWRSGIHPGARRLSRARAAELRAALVEVLEQGIRNGGTTLRDYRTVDDAPGGNQRDLSCYGRAGLPCLRCGELLVRRVLDGRSTTWCRRCQTR